MCRSKWFEIRCWLWDVLGRAGHPITNSGTYDEVVTTKPTTLYRVISDDGNPAVGYWTTAKPRGPLQSVIDSALDQNWGNKATRIVEMEVPPGTKLFEGVAAQQRALVGGGNQIYFDRSTH